MNFSEYYDHYLTLHQNKTCRRLHVLGNLATVAFVICCVVTRNWIGLVATPFVVYPFAWLGHLVYEKNKPLSWDGFKDYGWSTLKSKACDWIMMKDILLGKIK